MQDKQWEAGQEPHPSASWASLGHSLPLHSLVRVSLQVTSRLVSLNPQVAPQPGTVNCPIPWTG